MKSIHAYSGMTPLKSGKSGAQVFLTDRNTVIKTVCRHEAEDALWQACLREIQFHDTTKDAALPFLPEILYTEQTEDRLILEMRQYRPMNPHTVTKVQMTQILSALAQLHALPAPSFLTTQTPPQADNAALTACADGWRSVLGEHGERFSAYQSFPDHATAAFHRINSDFDLHRADLCHGDFHIGNLLWDDDDRPILIDFQGCCIGDGVGDLSFFHSRLIADGISLPMEELMQIYSANSGIPVSTLRLGAALANFNTSFLFWHQYLHGSDAERVTSIFHAMRDDFLLLTSEY